MKHVIELDAGDIATLRAALQQLLPVAAKESRDNHTAIGRRTWLQISADCLRLDTLLYESTLPKSEEPTQ